MGTAKIEKLIGQLKPEYLDELANFIDYLLYIQKKESVAKGDVVDKAEAEVSKEEEKIPERLRIARQYFDTAPKPHFPVSKYDVYEQ